MSERPSAKEIVSFLIGFLGVILLCCGAEDLVMQVMVSGIGLIVIGLAYLTWVIWSLCEGVNK